MKNKSAGKEDENVEEVIKNEYNIFEGSSAISIGIADIQIK